MYVLIRYVAFALSYTQPHSLPDEFPASRPYCRCTFSSAFAYLLLRRFPLAFCHKLPYICFACIHFTSLQFPMSLAKRCSVCSSVRNPLVSWWGLSYFPCGSFPCVSRSILYAFIVRIVQFMPGVFGSCFLIFSNEFVNVFPVGPCYIRFAFLVCDTARFLCAKWYISLYINLQVFCLFHVFPFRFLFCVQFFSGPPPDVLT